MSKTDTCDKITFEQSLKMLEESSNKLAKDGGTLEESIKAYEDGLNYYKICKDILDSAEQRITEISNREDYDDE